MLGGNLGSSLMYDIKKRNIIKCVVGSVAHVLIIIAQRFIQIKLLKSMNNNKNDYSDDCLSVHKFHLLIFCLKARLKLETFSSLYVANWLG